MAAVQFRTADGAGAYQPIDGFPPIERAHVPDGAHVDTPGRDFEAVVIRGTKSVGSPLVALVESCGYGPDAAVAPYGVEAVGAFGLGRDREATSASFVDDADGAVTVTTA